MTEEEFINNKIIELTSIFSEIIAGYEFKSESKTHFIKIFPENVLQSKEFKLWSADFISKYLNIFNNSISFISEHSLVKLDLPEVYYGFGKTVGDNQSDTKSKFPVNFKGM